ncbi:MAG: sugar ABC transporter permease [Streptosporangiaceae bacterium]
MASTERDDTGKRTGNLGADPAGPEPEVIDEALVATASPVVVNSLGEYASVWLKRLRSGESGVLPVLLGLAAIVIYFQARNSLFLSAGNLVNLMTQAAFIVTFGMAEVFVLLVGDIDLSVGYNAGLGGVIVAWLLSMNHPYPLWVAVIAGLAFSAAFAGLQGLIITWLRLPAFIVTLAGYLGGYGLLLYLIDVAAPNSGGTIRLDNSILIDIEYGSLSAVASWVVMALLVALTAIYLITRDARRRRSNLAAPPASVTLLKVAFMALAGVVVVLISNINRSNGTIAIEGVPWVVVLLLALLVVYTVLLNRTRFGRYVYAIGGNAEAARRAGINVSRIRVLAFLLAGLTAAITGIIYTSYLGSIGSNIQGGTYVLYAVAAAVIGGTSLFGGRGSMVGAVLGGLIVGAIYNGLQLLGFGAAAQNIWTAAVLLAAVALDAVARRGSTASR